ncbi:MAG TPA: hypothetical protein VEC57_16395 [Candidatus Limnocylindrales bacterium]|nr:hypothetical protein [Candidatus Limnocylindrales bacterium]
MGLEHATVHEDAARIALRLPLGDELARLHPGGCFPLIEDPSASSRSIIIGMFVLRPARRGWTAPLLEDGEPRSMYEVEDWTFNVRGVDGGWLIAGGNPLDAFRLALQYGLADAVIVGSNTVSKEGVDHGPYRGYLWQPYGPVRWPQVARADPHVLDKILRLRRLWQERGVLSRRPYPAQIVVSQSGEHKMGTADIFDARIFHDRHPDGSAIEVLVLTSEAGAEKMAARARGRGLGGRCHDMFVAVSPEGRPAELDIAAAAQVLRSRHDIRIANHDGGATVLSKFSEAGVLPQMNLTLMRGRSVYDVLSTTDRLPLNERERFAAEFDQRRQLFWSGDHKLPAALRPAYVVTDGGDAAVVTFDARAIRGL